MTQRSFFPVIRNGGGEVSVDSAKLAVSYYLSGKLRVNLVKHPLLGWLGWQNGLNYLVKLPSFLLCHAHAFVCSFTLSHTTSRSVSLLLGRVAFVTCNDACGSLLPLTRDQVRGSLTRVSCSEFLRVFSTSFEGRVESLFANFPTLPKTKERAWKRG